MKVVRCAALLTVVFALSLTLGCTPAHVPPTTTVEPFVDEIDRVAFVSAALLVLERKGYEIDTVREVVGSVSTKWRSVGTWGTTRAKFNLSVFPDAKSIVITLEKETDYGW
ncbi:MAG: hypothetical protein O3A46_12270, partial [Candidatus Poribacteria bacterium]|nr:hypothetical protein [Candidatus Poribacteria bacterium]